MFTYLGELLGFLSGRKRSIFFASIISMVIFGVIDYLLDTQMSTYNLDLRLQAGLQAAVVGVGAGLLALITLLGLRTRRRLMTEELKRLAELNHTVRNSLDVIIMAQQDVDDIHKKIVWEYTQRIDQKLKQLFPVHGFEMRSKNRDKKNQLL